MRRQNTIRIIPLRIEKVTDQIYDKRHERKDAVPGLYHFRDVILSLTWFVKV